MDTPHPQMLALGAEMRPSPSLRDSWPPHPSRLRGVPHPRAVNGGCRSTPSPDAWTGEGHTPHPGRVKSVPGGWLACFQPRPHMRGVETPAKAVNAPPP